MAKDPATGSVDRYQWVALANTTAAMFMAALDGSIVIIAPPAILRGIGLDPLAPGSIFYLLWMIMGYRLVQAVLVVSLGRLGDAPWRQPWVQALAKVPRVPEPGHLPSSLTRGPGGAAGGGRGRAGRTGRPLPRSA